MNLSNDLKYPFGNPDLDKMKSAENLIALKNVLCLARERIWLADSRPASMESFDFGDFMGEDDLRNAKRSADLIDQMLNELQNDT